MKAWMAVPAALAVLTACNPMTIRYDYDRNAGFQGFKTYNWYAASPKAKGKGRPEAADNPIMDRRVRRIVEAELAARGYRLAAEGEPDFLLTYYPVYQDRVVHTYTAMGPAWGYGWGYRPWGYGVATGFHEVQHFREGSIVLEVVDNRTDQMIWQAIAEGALTGIRDPQDAEEQVTQAIRRMLAKFPPPPGKN